MTEQQDLIKAIAELTLANRLLVQHNAWLMEQIQLMQQQAGDEDEEEGLAPGATYMDGTPV